MKHFSLKTTTLLLLVFILAFALLALPGCSDRGTSDNGSKKFRIAVVTWVGHGPFYLAKEKGFFEKHGLDVDIQLIEDIGARRSALLAKKLDGIISSVDAFAVAASKKMPAKTIMKLGEGDGADGIVAKENIKKMEDLKGKTVAYPRGEPSHFFLLLVLDEAGMSIDDIKSRHMTAGDAGAAFVAGAVDACVTWEPWVTTAKEKGKGNILATSKAKPGLLVDSFVVHTDYLSANPEQVKAFMAGWFEAIEYWKKNPDESNKIMAKSLGIPVADFEAMLSGYKFSDYDDNIKYFGTVEKPGQYWQVFKSANKLWEIEKIIQTPGKPEEYTDITLLRKLN